MASKSAKPPTPPATTRLERRYPSVAITYAKTTAYAFPILRDHRLAAQGIRWARLGTRAFEIRMGHSPTTEQGPHPVKTPTCGPTASSPLQQTPVAEKSNKLAPRMAPAATADNHNMIGLCCEISDSTNAMLPTECRPNAVKSPNESM